VGSVTQHLLLILAHPALKDGARLNVPLRGKKLSKTSEHRLQFVPHLRR